MPEDLLRLRFVSDPQISPDGRRVLFTRKHVGEKNDYATNLWITELTTGAVRQFTSGDKDGHGRFSPDGTRIAFIAGREEAKPQIYAMPAEGGEATALTGFPEGKLKSFRWSPDGTLLAVAFREVESGWSEEAKKRREETGASPPPRVIDDLYYRLDGDGYFNAQRFKLSLVDTESGEHRLLFDRDTLGEFSYDWAPDSSELVVSANTRRDALLRWWKDALYRVPVGRGRPRKIPNLPDGTKTAVCWSPDGRRIAFAGREGKKPIWGVENAHLFVCDPDGSNYANLTAAEDYCLAATTLSDSAEPVFGANFCWSPDGRRLYMSLGWQGETQIASVPADGGAVEFHTRGRQTVSLGNISDDGRQIALTAGDATRPPEVAVGTIERRGGRGSRRAASAVRLRRLTGFNDPLLEECDIAEPEPQWIEADDGTRVHAWVLKPPGFKKTKKYPAVLEVHGGPHTQYGEAFFHEFQVLAAAGYVVVYGNPRGSKGYGEDHCTAIRGKWGDADWQDVQAITRFMHGLPCVDAQRTGIMGGSYGGYMTNWAVGHTDAFAAAITDRCVANLVSMVGSSDLPLVPGEYWDANSWDKTGPLWEQSPLRYFGTVNTPTLIIHSEGDLRCNVEQAEQVFAALKLRGVPTRFVRYPPNTSHGLSRNGPPDLRLHRLRQILDWWRTYLT